MLSCFLDSDDEPLRDMFQCIFTSADFVICGRTPLVQNRERIGICHFALYWAKSRDVRICFLSDLYFLSLDSDVFKVFSLQVRYLFVSSFPSLWFCPLCLAGLLFFPFCLTALQRDSCFGLPNIQQRRQDLYDRGFSMCLAVCILNPYLSVCLYFKFVFCFLAH